MLTLQPYDLAVSYVPGKYMYLADTLSRAYIEGEPETPLDEMSRVVHSLIENTTVSAAKMEEICEASDADLMLCQVKSLILDGWPKSMKSVPVEARAYWNVRDKLHIRIIIYENMQSVVGQGNTQDQLLVCCGTPVVPTRGHGHPRLLF